MPPVYPLPGQELRSRRAFLHTSASFATAALCSNQRLWGAVTTSPRLPGPAFSLGVASGDPAPDGFVLWTRLAPLPLQPGGGMPAEAVEVSWTVASDENLSRVVQSGRAVARPEWAHAVHVEVAGLEPDRWYWYQFRLGGEVSAKGRTRTLPPAGAPAGRLRFAFVSCQHYETGLFTAFEHLAREELDLIAHLGDYIYEGPGQDGRIRRHHGPELQTVDDYRARYAQYRTDPALQAAHAAVPWIVTWDDHEVANNYAGDIPDRPATREAFRQRRAAAYQAYFEHMPLRRPALPKGPDMLLYRRLDYGDLAAFHVLDTRQYRTDQPQGDGLKPPAPVLLDPRGTLLGDAQRDWLFRGLETSRAGWNILAQQVMVAPVDRVPGTAVGHAMDQWPGYEHERRRLLRHFRDARVRNPTVLTGDIHTNWANELLADFDRPEPAAPVGIEWVGTSISSGGDGTDQPRNLAKTLEENPFVKFHNAERGYVLCDVTPRDWTTRFVTIPYVTRPGAPRRIRASFRVESGQPRLQPA